MSPDQRRFEFEDEEPDSGRLTEDDERLPWPSPEWSEQLAAPVQWPGDLDDDLRRELLDAFEDEPAEIAPARATFASRMRLPARALIALVVVAGAATAIALGSAGGGSPETPSGPTTTGQVAASPPQPNARSNERRGDRAEVSKQDERRASNRGPTPERSGARTQSAAGAPSAQPTQAPRPIQADGPSIEFEPGPWLAE